MMNEQYLRKCGVSVWMITGDKPNTAISIGRSTGIIDKRTRNEDIIVLNRGEGNDYDTILKEIKQAEMKIKSNRMSGLIDVIIAGIPYALCVSGNMFSFITTSSERETNKESLTTALVHLAMKVSSVIFCRVFPKQKVVMLILDNVV